jgi:hypothetical protein
MIKLTFETKTIDVPYGDHFLNQESLFILAPSENSIKVILRSENSCVFMKSTMFKNKIMTRSQEDIKIYFKTYI